MLICDKSNGQNFMVLPRTRFSGNHQLYARDITCESFLEIIPNNSDLEEDLFEKINSIGIVDLVILTTEMYEELDSKKIDKLVSVVVPTFNIQTYVEETLDSIITQDYEFYEIVIVDDESDDDTKKVIIDYMSKHSCDAAIKFMQIPHIGNPGLSRNVAIYNLISQNSSYIAFMDGDDLYASSNCLSLLVKALSDSSKAFAAYGGYDTVSEKSIRIARPSMFKKDKFGQFHWRESFKLTWQNMAVFNLEPYHLQCLMVCKEVPFLPYTKRGEDAEYYGRLFKKSSTMYFGQLDGVIQVSELIAHYRKRVGSVSHRPIPEGQSRQGKVERTTSHDKSDVIPPFYRIAGIPERYITQSNISQWAAKRWVRLFYRAIFSGNVKNGLLFLSVAFHDRRVKKKDLFLLPIKQLISDPTFRDMALVYFNRFKKREGKY